MLWPSGVIRVELADGQITGLSRRRRISFFERTRAAGDESGHPTGWHGNQLHKSRLTAVTACNRATDYRTYSGSWKAEWPALDVGRPRNAFERIRKSNWVE